MERFIGNLLSVAADRAVMGGGILQMTRTLRLRHRNRKKHQANQAASIKEIG